MKKLYVIGTLALTALLAGCGGGGSSSHLAITVASIPPVVLLDSLCGRQQRHLDHQR